MAPSFRWFRPAGRAPVLAALATAALAVPGCGDEPDEPAPTRFAAALETLGAGVEPSGSGYGWIDIEEVRDASSEAAVVELAGALGPGAGSVLEDSREIERRTGLDPLAAERALSVSGSYALGFRLDDVGGARLRRILLDAGAREEPLKSATALDLGAWSERSIAGPLSPLEAYGARTAFGGGSVVLARDERAREALVDDEESPLAERRISLATQCLGDADAARILPGGLTYNKAAAPDFVAAGVGEEGWTVCAVGLSEAEAAARAADLEEAFGPDRSDPVTGEPMHAIAADAAVETLAGGGAHAARVTIQPAEGTRPSLLFAAFDRGSVLTWMGAPPPIP